MAKASILPSLGVYTPFVKSFRVNRISFEPAVRLALATVIEMVPEYVGFFIADRFTVIEYSVESVVLLFLVYSTVILTAGPLTVATGESK